MSERLITVGPGQRIVILGTGVTTLQPPPRPPERRVEVRPLPLPIMPPPDRMPVPRVPAPRPTGELPRGPFESPPKLPPDIFPPAPPWVPPGMVVATGGPRPAMQLLAGEGIIPRTLSMLRERIQTIRARWLAPSMQYEYMPMFQYEELGVESK